MKTYMALALFSAHWAVLSTDKKIVNLDKTGDIFITKDRKKSCSSYKTLYFSATKPHKVVVQSGATLDMGSLARTIVFCGKADLVVESGGNLNFTGEKLCMNGSTKIIFTPPA